MNVWKLIQKKSPHDLQRPFSVLQTYVCHFFKSQHMFSWRERTDTIKNQSHFWHNICNLFTQERQGVHKDSLRNIRALQNRNKKGNVGFWGEGNTGLPWKNPLGVPSLLPNIALKIAIDLKNEKKDTNLSSNIFLTCLANSSLLRQISWLCKLYQATGQSLWNKFLY